MRTTTVNIILHWVEGNRYAAWLVNEEKDIHVFLGYHFVLSQLPIETIQNNLAEGLLKTFKLISGVKEIGS